MAPAITQHDNYHMRQLKLPPAGVVDPRCDDMVRSPKEFHYDLVKVLRDDLSDGHQFQAPFIAGKDAADD
jgi:hypothetical protein